MTSEHHKDMPHLAMPQQLPLLMLQLSQDLPPATLTHPQHHRFSAQPTSSSDALQAYPQSHANLCLTQLLQHIMPQLQLTPAIAHQLHQATAHQLPQATAHQLPQVIAHQLLQVTAHQLLPAIAHQLHKATAHQPPPPLIRSPLQATERWKSQRLTATK